LRGAKTPATDPRNRTKRKEERFQIQGTLVRA